MRKLIIFCILIFASLQGVSFAVDLPSVVINEVAWMGTLADSNDEWIELRNTTDAEIDLAGWSLVSSDGTPSIDLSGKVIAAQGFLLLERTDDTTIPAIPADKIYSGSLSNSGEILILKNSEATEIDRIDGSAAWDGKGDNVTKQTLIRLSDGSLATSAEVGGTPRAANESPDSTAPTTTPSPAGATFTSAQTVTLTANEAATIYYTLDGGDPTEDSSTYSTPLEISEDTTLKFFAKDAAGNSEAIKTENYVIHITSATAEAGEVLINEVAWVGSSDSSYDEWIELRNTTSKTFNLAGWKIHDELDPGWEIVLAGELAPNGYFLLERTDDDSSPAAADQFFTGSISNTGEILTLQDSAVTEVDRVDGSSSWSIGGDASTYHTLARVDATTFRSSKEVNGSPKAANFKDDDLAVSALTASTSNPLPNESITFTATLENTGLNTQSAFTLRWLVDGEEAASEEITSPFSRFTTLTKTFTQSFAEGNHTVSAEIVLVGDSEASNDSAEVGFAAMNHLLINEFVPDPEGSDATSEWIEIYNPTDAALDLTGWNLNGVNLSGEILPGAYLVVTATTTNGWKALASASGTVNLKQGGVTVDSRSYTNAEEKKSFGRNSADLTTWLEFFHPTLGSANFSPEANQAPLAKITIQGSGSTSGNCSLYVNLTGEDSTDADGDELTYEWSGISGDADEVNPAGFYFQTGSYTVSLTVTDSLGETSTDSKSFAVMGCGGGGTPAAVAVDSTPEEIALPSILASEVIMKITEISIDSENDWIEVQMLDDGAGGKGAEIGGFYFEDDKNIKTIPRGVTLKTGEFLLLTFNSDSPDATAIQDNVWKLFSPRSGITKTDEQIILRDSAGSVEDAVVWENRNGAWSRGEDTDTRELIDAGGWNSPETTAALDSSKLFRDVAFARFSDNRDTDAAADWFTTIFTTPGKPNGKPPTHAKDFTLLFSEVEFKNPTGDRIQIICRDCAQPVDLTGFFINTGLRDNLLKIPDGMEISTAKPIEIIFGAEADSVSGNTIYSSFPGLVGSDGLLSLKDFENTTADFVGWSDRQIPKLRAYDLSMAEFTQLQKRVKNGEWNSEDTTALLDSREVKRGGKIRRKASPDTNTASDWEILPPDKELEEIEAASAGNIYFSEVLPNPVGPDGETEWFELHNAGKKPVELYGWSVMVGSGVYEFESSTILQPQEFRAFLGLLPIKNTGSDFTLVDFEGNTVDSITYPEVPEGKSYAKASKGWKITGIPTPNAANGFFQILSEKEDSDGDGLSNADEKLAGSDAELFDTDGDLLSDAFEVERGLNPNSPDATPEDLRAYQQELAALTASSLTTKFDEKNGAFLAGVGIPGGVMRLYLQSELQILEIPIDAEGNWSYTLDTSLEAGSHNIFTQLITPSGVTGVARKVLSFNLPNGFTPLVFASEIRVSETLPNPAGEDSASEWIEIENYSSASADISGFRLTSGKKSYEFPQDSILAAGEFLLMPRSVTKLALANTNGKVSLALPTGRILSQVNYAKTKEGVSLAYDGKDYVFSTKLTPGEVNQISIPPSKNSKAKIIYHNGSLSSEIVISEILPNPAGSDTKTEWIELQNLGNVSVNLGNWQLDDSAAGSKPFRIPDTITLQPGEFRIFPRSLTKLALNNSGSEAARLFDYRGRLVASVSFRDISEGVSYARESDGEYRETASLTPAEVNAFDTEKIEGKVEFIGEDGFILQAASGEKFISFGIGSKALLAKALLSVGEEWKVFIKNTSGVAVLASFETPSNLLQPWNSVVSPKLGSKMPWVFTWFFLIVGFFISLRSYLHKRLLAFEKA